MTFGRANRIREAELTQCHSAISSNSGWFDCNDCSLSHGMESLWAGRRQWQQSRCPWRAEWRKKQCCIHKMNTQQGRNDCYMQWYGQTSNALSCTQESTYYMIPFIRSPTVGKANVWWKKIRTVAANYVVDALLGTGHWGPWPLVVQGAGCRSKTCSLHTGWHVCICSWKWKSL